MKDVIFLVDCDGVCIDFVSQVLNEINTRAKTKHVLSDVRRDFRDLEGYSEDTEKFIRSEMFCRTLPKIKGAKEGITELRKMGKVICLTSPYNNSKHWIWERIEVLKTDFGFTREEMIFAKDKRYIFGNYLIDDLPKNLIDWTAFNKSSLAICFNQPWNAEDELTYPEGSAIARCNDWAEVLESIEAYQALNVRR